VFIIAAKTDVAHDTIAVSGALLLASPSWSLKRK